ncbi:MAG: GntR family transcriptional regulator [Hoeflea sp.]|uniref:GntR family transcriptional regulator n=1 Tax=Hoeflea sp. TaxID=1940281 RepID=UPI001E112805|nr:GntR family transcriptional regulator [Hoeflea sp.]MBU4528117.1 GntR family transcriptional regulator [Alphaproteobacteria bacterium]MBU4543713.1 GntR family transcriptional regulator [Alphaproteobacteria bacterium]MBU4548580.1 GntR family transcriptional regulator [Alphaproteobacteria bacterium]MBV1725746.1 GntR family transcriptional regulator [Hoeflea sp.]MBV1762102.1 GntR family transcriptional regulator [Hoeflea sp.]
MNIQASSPMDGPGLDRLSPVERETVQDRIYRQLRDALIQGRFDAGEIFLAGDVAQRMSVSSMPVREALARLVSERALEAMPNRRVRVPLLTLERARDIAQARSLIEGELAARAMENLSAADIARLEALTGEYERTREPRDIATLNHAFHFQLYHAAGSSVLMPIIESLWMQAGPYVRAAAKLHRPLTDRAATLHHRGILSAVAAGDRALVASELKADINQAFAILERADPDFWVTENGAAA